jgi:hypothetical protein
MVILMLAAILTLSAAMSIGSVQPVLGALDLFAVLYVVFLMACMLHGYARTRATASIVRAASRVHQPARTAVLRSRAPTSR